MFLEARVLEFLNTRKATPREISEEIHVPKENIEDVLNRLRSAGLLLEG